MSQIELRRELCNRPSPAPLLPSEKKLIGWSLGTGLALLAALAIFSHFVPTSL